jgi:hypothetical protein
LPVDEIEELPQERQFNPEDALQGNERRDFLYRQIGELSQVPGFRLKWIDYALSLFVAGMR